MNYYFSSDSGLKDWELKESSGVVGYTELNSFVASTGYKVIFCGIPDIWDDGGIGFMETIKYYKSLANKVVIVNSELHEAQYTLLENTFEKISHRDIIFYLSGRVNDAPWDQRFNGFWMDRIVGNSYSPGVKWNTVKKKSFDVLLGSKRYHRDFVWNHIKSKKIDGKVVMTYKPLHAQYVNEVDESGYILEPGITSIDENPIPINGVIEYSGKMIEISRVLPTSIYDQTAFSLIAETEYSNGWSFFTEKTAKPLYSKRLFIVISGYKFLENLRKIGFRTFDGIIDESYDQEPNDITRWTMALEQMEKLMEMSQPEVFEKIQDIVEHNYQLVTSKPRWYGELLYTLPS